MGTYNSSLTRVVPVSDALIDRDPSGRTRLLRLLQLGSRAVGRLDEVQTSDLLPDHPHWWGKKERRLAPPRSLMRWLVANACAPPSDILWGGKATREKRTRLVARDADVINEALHLLETSATFRKWYVLEGRSQPDAFLEADTALVVIEGKRTERKATTFTTWMPSRSQMLRHMDAAWDIRGGKPVFGMMIVKGPGGAEATAPSKHWVTQANDQVLIETLAASLPHREPREREQIAARFLGVTTWQRVSEFGLGWPPFQDTTNTTIRHTTGGRA
jgi:hypothetical protein